MKIINFILLFYLLLFNQAYSNSNFDKWLISFSEIAYTQGISKKTIDNVLIKAKFLPDVIRYDRYQPEFYEDTKTYVQKRVSKKKVQNGVDLFKKNSKIIKQIEKEFNVEKELLLALMGIETNYGNYLGKMDIISSLATLSFDQRRSEFFSKELITVLKLIDLELVEPDALYGSWAGAFGNFQFMPSTINKYAVDYDKNNFIDLKSINDSFASAANYVNKIGWNRGEPCFKKINLKKNTPLKFLNTSARKIKFKKKLKYYKKYILDYDNLQINENMNSAIVTPDKDIVKNADNLSPAFIVFDNYELVLKWNRSLRFAIAVCTLKDNFKNEL